MSEREPTAEELAFLEQFRQEVGQASTSDSVSEVEQEQRDTGAPKPTESVVEEEESPESDEAQFIERLFRRKPGQEEWVRRLHGGNVE